MKKKAIIISIKGHQLSTKEKELLANEKPWGLILFKRNIKSLNQIKKLIKKIRKLTKEPRFPIMIDEEGVAVSRLGKIINHNFSQKFLGDIYKINNKIGLNFYKNYINNLTTFLKKIGININTVPVLDVLRKNTNKIIGNRSFSDDPDVVRTLGKICVKQYKLNKLATVMKHVPGHGLAKVDSHKLTPVVKKKIKYLYKNDFIPFKNKKTFFAMTAHVIYKDIDPINTATHSPKIIKLIRKKIGFKNIIISDDISMKGLKYSIKQNLNRALSAGCNLILHCNANYSEMRTVAENSPNVDNFIIQKTSQFYKFLS